MKDIPVIAAIRDINTYLKDRSDQDRRVLIAIGLGRAISYRTPLPSMPVASIEQHFQIQCEPAIRDFVSRINEMYIIDHELVRSTAKMLYVFRYNLTYDPYTVANALDRLAVLQEGVIPEAYRGMLNTVTSSQEMVDKLANVMVLFQSQIEQTEDSNKE